MPSTLLSTYLLTQPRWRSTTCGGRARLSVRRVGPVAGRGEALCARSSLRREDARRSRLRVGLLQDELPQVLASRAASPSPLAVPHPFQTPGGASTACRQTRGQENRIFGIVSIIKKPIRPIRFQGTTQSFLKSKEFRVYLSQDKTESFN